MLFYCVAMLLASVTGSMAQCARHCMCFPVSTTDTTLKSLEKGGPLYLQAASTESISLDLDSVCMNISPTIDPDTSIEETIYTYTNGSQSQLAILLTQMRPGVFLAGGINITFTHFVISMPCSTAYVLYRCRNTGVAECMKDPTRASVYVVSVLRKESSSCIEDGIQTAQSMIPGVQFYRLPRTELTPCKVDLIFIDKAIHLPGLDIIL